MKKVKFTKKPTTINFNLKDGTANIHGNPIKLSKQLKREISATLSSSEISNNIEISLNIIAEKMPAGHVEFSVSLEDSVAA